MVGKAFTYANLSNLAFVEQMYQSYKQDPTSIDSSWQYFFEGMEFASGFSGDEKNNVAAEDLRVYLLVQAYRSLGHTQAMLDPIFSDRKKENLSLSISNFGFTDADMTKEVSTFGVLPVKVAKLSQLMQELQRIYCGHMGVEFTHVSNQDLVSFIQKYVEGPDVRKTTSNESEFILQYLSKAELLESFIHTRYVGQKRFSLEGAETLIPMLAALLDKGAGLGLESCIMGMAHRGRLNVLVNILNKSYSSLFHEFEDHYFSELGMGTGDVKYHKGYEGSLSTQNGKNIHVTLIPNPSHLESVDPLVEGRCKAMQELNGSDPSKVLPILIHGDASVAGQGVVYETLQLSKVDGYSTGGTVHIVINNQIGFTTTPSESRSTLYCTDIAKTFDCPVFHVNAEDPDACVSAAILAIEIRQKFGCDVFIDLSCYRKYGHNEGDEPAFTQPLQYKVIRSKASIRTMYKDKLIGDGLLSAEKFQQMEAEYKSLISQQAALVPAASEAVFDPDDHYKISEEIVFELPQMTKEKVHELAARFCQVPQGFAIHPKVQRLFKDRLEMFTADPLKQCIDFGAAEYLCFAVLLSEGVHLRLSGQDCQRGTFSHRHAVWVDQSSMEKYFPLRHLAPSQAPFEVLNSPLSEYAVLGFELGYSISYPNTLTIWEAQYGDFANTAQVIIDQYISSSEQKWNVTTNLVMLLPHGYEGQGPEHSSARMERYLQLAGQGNMIIVNATTPAQHFHLLRRQAHLKNKKPLIVFSPKALLRLPAAQSCLSEIIDGSFKEVIPDTGCSDPHTILFCTGKVYYDLVQEREKRGKEGVAIVRIEQLYPFPKEQVKDALSLFNNIKKIRWVQEEHANMGAWEYIRPCLSETLKTLQIEYVGRLRSAATAAGSYALHKKQYQKMMEEAFS